MLGDTRLRPRVQGTSPSLGRRGAGAQQAGPGAQRCAPFPVTFPCLESAATPRGEAPARGGEAARAPPRAPLGGRTERRGSQHPGLGANRGSPSGLDPGPATRPPAWVPAQNPQSGCAPGAGAGTDEPTAGNSTTWRPRRPGPASSRGEPEPGTAAGCPRDPGRRRPPWASPASAASTGRAPRPCPGDEASAPRAPHGAPGPRSPLTEAAAAPGGRRSVSLPPFPVSRALRPREATGGAHGWAGAGSSSACAAIAVASRVRGSAAMSARLTLSASLAARPPQPRSSLRRRVRGGRVPPLAAPRHSALQPSFLTLFCPSLPLSPRLIAYPVARWSWGAYPAPAGLLYASPGGVPGAPRP